MPDTTDEILFNGSNIGPDQFVRAVRKAAFGAQKERDDGWCADFASTCLEGDALYFYEDLEDEVRHSWKLLARAVLDKFQANRTRSTDAPEPAAAGGPNVSDVAPIPSTPTSSTKAEVTGLLRAVDEQAFTIGYFSTIENRDSTGMIITRNPAKALRLRLQRSNYSRLVTTLDNPLMVVFQGGPEIFKRDRPVWATLGAREMGPTAYPDVWMACKDGSLDCAVRVEGGSRDRPITTRIMLQPAVDASTGEIRLFTKLEGPNAKTFQRARLIFEPYEF